MSNGHVKFDADESPARASAVTDRQDDVLVISKKDKEVHSSSDEESDDDDDCDYRLVPIDFCNRIRCF